MSALSNRIEDVFFEKKNAIFIWKHTVYVLDENDELKKRVKFLETQNRNLMNQLRKLQESVMAVRIWVLWPRAIIISRA